MALRRVITPTPAALARLAEPSDAAELARLLDQLGYPVAEQSLRRRLEASAAGRVVLVAELDGQLAGLAVLQLTHPLHLEVPQAELSVLVTDAHHRHRGVARVLLTEVARLARQQGCRGLSLRCHRRRDDAHTFYRRFGFEETHLSFAREL